ncbi:hypothetical protein AYO41_00860 [Verrucomicrobia bacterium SCGC AG-212-E04]|nr:hypothetical protein AYO41_00860 [Verrucomicrobia bacterium SCGC AG-212-E04]
MGRSKIGSPGCKVSLLNEVIAYKAQLGNIAQANEHLAAAISLDHKFERMGMDDLDLEPLW